MPGTSISAADEIPAPPQQHPLALVNAAIHPVSQPPLENGVILFEGGRITALGANVEMPPGTEQIDCSGRHVYPGLIESHSHMGLIEISAARATDDQRECGKFNPNVRAQVAVNPDSAVIPVTRSSGVLLALSAPGGGTITGRSALLQLDGWTYEDLTLKADVAMHLFWPGTLPAQPTIDPRTNPWPPSPEEIRAEMQALRQFFDQARAYESACQATSEGQNYDARLEAMRPVVRGELPLMIRADTIAQIESAVAFAAEQGTRLIILGGYDAPLCAPMLDEHDVSVIVSSVYRLPMRRHEPFDHAYTLPARLLQAGVPFCISGTDRSETWNTRLLPCHAAMAAAHGLPRDEALKAITLYPAEILGVADRVGSLEVGKDATLIVTDGDPLETTTQTVLAFIQGRNIALSNKQTRLYDKYRQKYEQLQHSQPRRPNP